MTIKRAHIQYDGPGRIKWLSDKISDVGPLKTIVSPSASLIAAGLSMVSAGASIFTAFQIKRQERALEGLSAELKGVKTELAELQEKTAYLIKLVEKVSVHINLIKDFTVIQHLIIAPLDHFEKSINAGFLDIKRQVEILSWDFALAYAKLVKPALSKLHDVPLPAYIVDRYSSATYFLYNLNVFLLDIHNKNQRDSRGVRQYFRLENSEVPSPSPLESLKQDFYLASGKTKDGKTKKNGKQLYRTQWLIALRWEIEHMLYSLSEASSLREGRTRLRVDTLSENSEPGW